MPIHVRTAMWMAVGAALVAASDQALASAGVTQLSHGVSGVERSMKSGDFAGASSALGGLFDAGGGGFAAGAVPVGVDDDAGAGTTGGGLLPAEQRGAAHSLRAGEVPAPTKVVSDGREADFPSGWPIAAMAGAILFAYLQKDNEGASDVDREAKRQNPRSDPKVEEGLAKQKEDMTQRKFNDFIVDRKPKENDPYEIKPTGGNATGGGAH